MNTSIENFQSEQCRVYQERWLILAIFVIFSATNEMQWIQYSIIANVVSQYYHISYSSVDWTSLIFMVVYIPFIFPGSYVLDKWGLRVAIIAGSLGNCLGALIKIASVSPDRFWVGFTGQTLAALSQVFILSIPARLAAVWFGPKQVSTACSIGVFGNQLGIAIGFLLPPILVNGEDEATIARGLYVMFIFMGALTTLLFILILFFFKAAPPTPPSVAQVQQNQQVEGSEYVQFFRSIKSLCLNPGYMLLLTSYGINVGMFYAISTLLNQIILKFYPDAGADAGRIGLIMVLAGMLGSLLSGIILDKFHRFKETTLAIYFFCLLGMVTYTFTLDLGIVIVYIVSAFLGFFMTGLLPVGFEFAAELTFPEPEGTSAGFLNMASQVFGIIFTSLYSWLFNKFGATWANGAMSIMLAVGTVLMACIKSNLKRQAAQTISTKSLVTIQ